MSKFNLMGPGSKSDVIPYTTDLFKKNYTMNTGNMLFFYACEQVLELSEKRFGWGYSNDEINKQSNGVILPMANQIGNHFDLNATGPKIDKIETPIIAMGLGSQLEYSEDNFELIPEGTITWLKSLASKSSECNISLRGNNTLKFLERMGLKDSAIVLGCPSLQINPSVNLGHSIKEKFNKLLEENSLFSAFSVAAGDPHHKDMNLSAIERRLIRLIEIHDGEYVVQNPEILIKLTNGWHEDLNYQEYELVRKRWFEVMTHREIQSWFKRYARCFISVPQWIYNYSNRSLVVGTRIHGVQTAIQAGTPAVCICIDARTKELCETMKLPHIESKNLKGDFTQEQLIAVIEDWDHKEFDQNRIQLARNTKDFLLINGASYSKNSLLGSINEK